MSESIVEALPAPDLVSLEKLEIADDASDSEGTASLQNGKSSVGLLGDLTRVPGNQLSPLLDRRSKIIPDGMGSVQTFGSVHLVRLILCTSGTPDTVEICVGNSF
jgi:hypothetical protein